MASSTMCPPNPSEIPLVKDLVAQLGYGDETLSRGHLPGGPFQVAVHAFRKAFVTSDGRRGQDLITWKKQEDYDELGNMSKSFVTDNGARFWPADPEAPNYNKFKFNDEGDRLTIHCLLKQLFWRQNSAQYQNRMHRKPAAGDTRAPSGSSSKRPRDNQADAAAESVGATKIQRREVQERVGGPARTNSPGHGQPRGTASAAPPGDTTGIAQESTAPEPPLFPAHEPRQAPEAEVDASINDMDVFRDGGIDASQHDINLLDDDMDIPQPIEQLEFGKPGPPIAQVPEDETGTQPPQPEPVSTATDPKVVFTYRAVHSRSPFYKARPWTPKGKFMEKTVAELEHELPLSFPAEARGWLFSLIGPKVETSFEVHRGQDDEFQDMTRYFGRVMSSVLDQNKDKGRLAFEVEIEVLVDTAEDKGGEDYHEEKTVYW
jgi:hypothetical protein